LKIDPVGAQRVSNGNIQNFIPNQNVIIWSKFGGVIIAWSCKRAFSGYRVLRTWTP
jgi:hypothetical protein